MDHSLRSISYIADIGDLVVLMAKRRQFPNNTNDETVKRQQKLICHVFESDEVIISRFFFFKLYLCIYIFCKFQRLKL